MNMKKIERVRIVSATTKTPLTLIGTMVGVCQGSDTSDQDKNIGRAISCISQGHYRVLEYVDVYIVMSHISARVAREWYTHIGGQPTRLQESTRYVDCADFNAVIPPSISDNLDAFDKYSRCLDMIQKTYKALSELGVPREDCAMVLPLGMTTKLSLKHNARNLMDMSRQRMCSRAYWEYREIFRDLIAKLSEYSDEWKTLCSLIFKPKCEAFGKCTEKNSCGRMNKN